MDRVPVLKIGDILLVSIQVDLEDQTALQLQEDLADRIVETGCHGVIIDISAMDIVDSFIGRMLSTIASISRVLDAETVVVGMRPAVAITLVELGLSLNGIRTALNVERGMDLIAAAREAEGGHADEAADDDPLPLPAERPGSGSSITGGTAPGAGPWAATKP
jgi:rsbT antagonist protein RsbS